MGYFYFIYFKNLVIKMYERVLFLNGLYVKYTDWSFGNKSAIKWETPKILTSDTDNNNNIEIFYENK